MIALLLSGLLLTAEDIRALGETDDVRYFEPLARALELRLDEGSLTSPDAEEEVVACLLAMGRLDRERASAHAREVLSLSRGTPAGPPYWAALRVLARAGDRETIRRGLAEYFDAPDDWASVLGEAAPDDVRLVDFLPKTASTRGDVERRRRTLLAANLGIELEADARLDVAIESPGWESEPHDLVAFERALATLDRNARFRLLRSLAARDDEVLIGLPLDGETIGRLSTYLARSRYPVVRGRLVAASRHRGRALGAWLQSPRASDEEKRRALTAMRDGWAEALREPAVYRSLLSLIGPEALVERATTAALGHVPLASARARLERLAREDREAVRVLMTRDDRVLSLPLLYALERGGSAEVRREAELALLRLGAGGASLIMQARPEPPRADLVPLLLRSALAGDHVLRIVSELASDPSPSPSALAALYAVNAERPELFMTFLRKEGVTDALTERFHFVLSLAGERERIPLLVDLAVTESPRASRESAFVGLTEVELGSFDKRLHRLAGHPEGAIRFRAACALAPSGEPWVIRLLLADLDEDRPEEIRLARRALSRVEPEPLRLLLRAMVGDETASAFAVGFLIDLEARLGSGPDRALERSMWERLRDGVTSGRELALEAASRLTDRRARAAVAAYLEAR